MMKTIARRLANVRVSRMAVRALATAAPAAAAAKKLKINGKEMEVPADSTVLQACQQAGQFVPTLCNHPRLRATGQCRLCLVDVEQNGFRKLMPACITKVADGMNIVTDSPVVNESIKWNLSLLRANHPNSCMTCDANGRCEFQDLIFRYRVGDSNLPKMREMKPDTAYDDESSPAVLRAMDKCIKCGRCVRACSQLQGMSVLGFINRGANEVPTTIGNAQLRSTYCIECGQCASFCPVGAITERPAFRQVLDLLNGSHGEKVLVVQTAPAVRVAVGEELGLETGSVSTGQMVAGLRALGFDYVFDTDFSADLTIMEEGSELIDRLTKGGPFPMFTSCCPGWVTLVEKLYPEFMPNLSTAKSPQQMLGAVVKSYFAEKLKKKPEDIIMVSIMPCTAKKFEATRAEFRRGGVPDVDYVLTTRELGSLLRMTSVPLGNLPPEDYDTPLGLSTGAGVIFGASGGVMEAAVRTAYELLVKKPLPKLDFTEFRGLQGIKTANLTLDLPNGEKKTIRTAVANGMANVRHLLQAMKNKEVEFDFVEIMTCPGGCIGGGGQPKSQDPQVLQKRMDATYTLDERSVIRKSHENPAIAQLYKEYFGQPLSHKSHDLLHTHYHARPVQTPPVETPTACCHH